MIHTDRRLAKQPPPLLNVGLPELTAEKNFDANCTTSYVLNSGFTEMNLTKFLHDVQK